MIFPLVALNLVGICSPRAKQRLIISVLASHATPPAPQAQHGATPAPRGGFQTKHSIIHANIGELLRQMTVWQCECAMHAPRAACLGTVSTLNNRDEIETFGNSMD